jgi:uncharacterized protein YndB with AHSA1/START domain
LADHNVVHDTFTIERTFGAAPARVFAAFSSEAARSSWGDAAEVEQPHGGEPDHATEFDFRPGGRECFTTESQGTLYRYDGRYQDIVANRRIVYTYAMYADDILISVSLATVEFSERGDGTRLTWTEQGAYLDGYNGASAPAMRKSGTIDMIEGLTAYLQRQGTP